MKTASDKRKRRLMGVTAIVSLKTRQPMPGTNSCNVWRCRRRGCLLGQGGEHFGVKRLRYALQPSTLIMQRSVDITQPSIAGITCAGGEC